MMPVMVQFSSIQSLSCVWLFVTPWTAAHQASLSITNSRSLLRLMSIELVMPSNHLILSRPLLFLPSIFPSLRVFSDESVLRFRWPKYWNFSFSISPSNESWYLPLQWIMVSAPPMNHGICPKIHISSKYRLIKIIIKEEKITTCHICFGVHPRHLGSLLNAASGTSPPRNLNSRVWDQVKNLCFFIKLPK